ncbi:MAG TPA: response regulator [Anaerolineae bacterium]|nr:response regulator [Anaerolineae bacterium]
MSQPENTPPPTILIVDDNPDNVRFLIKALRGAAYTVRVEQSGLRAIEAARHAPPDLILLDITMPGMDGYEACRQLKADARTRDVPVIFLSAHHETLDKVKGFAAGGVDYITKPAQIHEVRARIATHLTLRRLQQQLEVQNIHLEHEIAERQRAEVALKQYHARILQATTLASLGEMATGVAHELNQPLTAMQLEADYLKTLARKALEIPSASLDAQELCQIGDNLTQDITRSRRITDYLRRFSEVLQAQCGPVNLNEPLQDCFILNEARLKHQNIHVRQTLAPDLPPIWANAHKLEHVFLNLINNAEYALAEMAARHAVSPTRHANYQKTLEILTHTAGNDVVAVIRDNGCGIPPDAQPRIFEPFFSLYPKSTHLGLATVRDFVIECGGRITLESAEDVGTTFRLEFPAAENPPPCPKQQP